MIDIREKLEIPLDNLESQMKMIIYPNMKGRNLLFVEDDHKKYNESRFQVFEGKKYIYELINPGDWCIDTEKTSGVFTKIKDGVIGGFNPNVFVGTFQIPFIHRQSQEIKYEYIEIRSTKISYEKEISDSDLNSERSEYQLMIEDIAEQSVDLVLQYNIPIQQAYESGSNQLKDENAFYQRFLFVRSLFKNQEFEESIQKIMSNPATRWITEEEDRDIRNVRKFTPKNIRELTSRSNRMPFPDVVPGLKDFPMKISSLRKIESVDTPENRFIKHVLASLLSFCDNIASKLDKAKLFCEFAEVREIAQRLENLINQAFFRSIKSPNSLNINSPVLQRRSGYRELLRAWLRFHLTAQLSWKFEKDKDNLFTGGKKDIAKLYEYWVFFILFKVLNEKFDRFVIKDIYQWLDGLIVPDKNGLGLILQEGKTRSFQFTYQSESRSLNIKFYYNRTFLGGRVYDEDKRAGSYSKAFRPDYTISIWPSDIKKQEDAEIAESIVHVHFDAKYKVENSLFKHQEFAVQETESNLVNNESEQLKEIEKIINYSGSESEINEKKRVLNEKINELGQIEFKDLHGLKLAELISYYELLKDEQLACEIITLRDKEESEGSFKNIDLYKMHSYKDAIRRSGGAYILYPGKSNDKTTFQGFHEIIPGVGAFSLRPNNEREATENIKTFIDKVIENLEDVLSHRERMAKTARKIYSHKYNKRDAQLDALIRQLGAVESADETLVLVGYCRGEQHKLWISGDLQNMRYNIRYGNGYDVNGQMAAARYLVLYSDNDFLHHEIYEIKPGSARIYTRDEMENSGYPKPSHSLYFVFELKAKIDLESSYYFDRDSPIFFSKLADLELKYRPFTLSLIELARIRIKVE